MKRNRLIALILLAGMLAGSFSCGDSAPGDETSGDQSDTPDATTASDTTSYLDALPKENLRLHIPCDRTEHERETEFLHR